MFTVQPCPLCKVRVFCKRKKALSVYRRRDLCPGYIQQRGHNIPQFRDTVAGGSGLYIGQYIFPGSDKQRNMAAPFIRAGFAEHMVVAQFFSMISCEDKYCVIINFLFDQGHDQTADLVVKMCDTCVVSDLSLAYKFRIGGACFRIKNPAVRFQILIRLPGTDERRTEFPAAVQVKIVLRRVKRRMRTQVGFRGSRLRRKSRLLSVTQLVG